MLAVWLCGVARSDQRSSDLGGVALPGVLDPTRRAGQARSSDDTLRAGHRLASAAAGVPRAPEFDTPGRRP